MPCISPGGRKNRAPAALVVEMLCASAMCRAGMRAAPPRSSALPIDFCSCCANGMPSLSTVNWEPKTSPLFWWDFIARPPFPWAQGCWGFGTSGWLLMLAVAGLMQCPRDAVPSAFPDDSPAPRVSGPLVLTPDSPLQASAVMPAALQRQTSVTLSSSYISGSCHLVTHLVTSCPLDEGNLPCFLPCTILLPTWGIQNCFFHAILHCKRHVKVFPEGKTS